LDSKVSEFGFNFLESIFNCKKEEVFEFYKKFIFSINFQSWLNQRMREAYFNDVIHLNFEEILKGASEVAIIDLYFRVLEEIKIEKLLSDANELIISKLIQFLKFMLFSIPFSIRISLTNQNVLFDEKDRNDLLKE
jgi:hypothetical protein